MHLQCEFCCQIHPRPFANTTPDAEIVLHSVNSIIVHCDILSSLALSSQQLASPPASYCSLSAILQFLMSLCTSRHTQTTSLAYGELRESLHHLMGCNSSHWVSKPRIPMHRACKEAPLGPYDSDSCRGSAPNQMIHNGAHWYPKDNTGPEIRRQSIEYIAK